MKKEISPIDTKEGIEQRDKARDYLYNKAEKEDNRKEVIKELKDGKNVYKVYCEYYIKAKNESEAEEIVIEDMSYNNFFEEHIMIEESELPDGQDIFNGEEN